MLYGLISRFNVKFLNEEISWNFYLNLEFSAYNLLILIIVFNFYKLVLCQNSVTSFLNIKYTLYFIYFILLLNYSNNSSPVTYFFFNHLNNSNIHNYISFLTLVSMHLILILIFNNQNIINKFNYNVIIYLVLLKSWLDLLFLCTNLFTLVFLIELISITLFIILSIFNTYKTVNFNFNYTTNFIIEYNHIKPTYQFYSLILLFWMSFITSINLFLYLIYFIYFINTFDFILIDYIVLYFNINSNKFNYLQLNFIFIGFIFTWFLKLGLVPFFFWKPNVFKGLPFTFISVYVLFFYFLFLIYSVYLFTFFLNELINYIYLFNVILIYIGLIFLIFFLFEITNIKVFIAYSSILNTLLVFIFLFFNYYNNIQYVYY